MKAKVVDIESDTRKNPEIWLELDSFFDKMSDAAISYYAFREAADRTPGKEAYNKLNAVSEMSEDPIFQAYFNVKSLMFQLGNKRPPSLRVLKKWKALLSEAEASGNKEEVARLTIRLKEVSSESKINLDIPEPENRKALREKLRALKKGRRK